MIHLQIVPRTKGTGYTRRLPVLDENKSRVFLIAALGILKMSVHLPHAWRLSLEERLCCWRHMAHKARGSSSTWKFPWWCFSPVTDLIKMASTCPAMVREALRCHLPCIFVDTPPHIHIWTHTCVHILTQIMTNKINQKCLKVYHFYV